MPRNGYALTSIRNFVFGVEDSLVSTVGLLSGVAVAGVPRATIVLTGLILIAVEALSMAVGSFLAEDTVEAAEHHAINQKLAASGALVMFFSYVIAGFIPLFPYFFPFTSSTVWYSIGLTFLGLLMLGISTSRLLNIPLIKSTARILILGGVAVIVGVLVGRLLPTI